MAKSEATLSIEQALRHYEPKALGGIQVNLFRGNAIAFEVPVEVGTNASGMIDCVRISEYWGDIEKTRYCYYATILNRQNCPCYEPFGLPAPDTCDKKGCHWNRVREVGKPKILIQCFEIKVSKADFCSANGHNFVGHVNYYVVPNEIYKDIIDNVPEDIGIITYHSESKRLMRRKDAKYRTMTDEEQKWMLLNVLKRIRRGGY